MHIEFDVQRSCQKEMTTEHMDMRPQRTEKNPARRFGIWMVAENLEVDIDNVS